VSAAQKYGRPVESLSAETLSQVKSAGQALADKGVTQSQAQSVGSPAPTPAMKYGGNDNIPQRSLHPSQSR
jgi:hypothetical protein